MDTNLNRAAALARLRSAVTVALNAGVDATDIQAEVDAALAGGSGLRDAMTGADALMASLAQRGQGAGEDRPSYAAR